MAILHAPFGTPALESPRPQGRRRPRGRRFKGSRQPEEKPVSGEDFLGGALGCVRSASILAPDEDGGGMDAGCEESYSLGLLRSPHTSVAAPRSQTAAAAAPLSEISAAAAPLSEISAAAAPLSEISAAAAPLSEISAVAAPRSQTAAAAAPLSEISAVAAPRSQTGSFEDIPHNGCYLLPSPIY
uniref:Uncharacterized protein n=1 Tax=Astyanax mexicanus TaxID=7994 RepID=A0A3B1JXF8_ASTMX